MEQLKTFDEIKLISKNAMFNVGANDQAKAIRAEAIKWVKYLSMKKEKEYNNQEYIRIIAKIQIIKHFFDITDEDLKWKKKNGQKSS